MKKAFSLFGVVALFAQLAPQVGIAQHRQCGRGVLMNRLAAENPEALRAWREGQSANLREHEARNALYSAGAKTTAQYAIPVVFHFVVTTLQRTQLGNDTGIRNRVKTQLAALNRDFNRQNGDSVSIPAAFKSRYGNVAIQFALANMTNARTISGGIEVLTITGTPPVFSVYDGCRAAKVSSTGLVAWDPNKYLNIWVCNISDPGSSGSQILGITTPPDDVGKIYAVGQPVITAAEKGIVLSYGAVGVRTHGSQSFFQNIDLGRTMTHEVGHYFNVNHIWGDDGGKCPGQSGGQDDNISDTPPQADATYCDGTGCPTFPKTDACSPSSPGIMFMNFMDYTDDRAMHMFTNGQASRMRIFIQPGAESYSLTQNVDLATNVTKSAVATAAVHVYPNPAKDALHVALDGPAKLRSIDLVNMLGQVASHTAGAGEMNLTLPLGGLPRGVYTVQCRFEEGTVTQKIVLE